MSTNIKCQSSLMFLERHVAEYGFIIRYPKGQSKQTGYAYEAWHIRYVGKTLAKIITDEHTNLDFEGY